jgi:hypothetical protein
MGTLSKLDPAIEKVEFKLTVLPAKEPRVQALLRNARVSPARRKVYFYDTPELALFKRDLVLRARVTDGDEDDSTVKLRPLPQGKISRWKKQDGVKIELDVVGKKQVPSAKLEGKPERGRIEDVEEGAIALSKLFSEAQEAVIKRKANGAKLNHLAVLGPVNARKWDLPAIYFPHKLAVEEWSLPDGSRFFELSFKVDPGEAASAKREFDELLDYLKIGRKGDPDPKTPKVLEFFAARL